MNDFPSSRRGGFTFVEFVVAMGVAAIVLSVLMVGMISVNKSMVASHNYAYNMNNSSRLLDYVARDLHRSVRVGMISGATYTKLPSSAAVQNVTDTNILAINIPDYYGSNTVDDAIGSSYKKSRYPRSSLGNGFVPWAQAVSGQRIRYNSTGTGEIQVRYYRGNRSASDATVCFFRREYASDTGTALSAAKEIAEQVLVNGLPTTLSLFDPDWSDPRDTFSHFRIQSTFPSRYRFATAPAALTDGYVDAYLRNPRRD